MKAVILKIKILFPGYNYGFVNFGKKVAFYYLFI